MTSAAGSTPTADVIGVLLVFVGALAFLVLPWRSSSSRWAVILGSLAFVVIGLYVIGVPKP